MSLTVRLEILRCKDCARLVLATASKDGETGTRLSHHKCSGRWETVLSECHPLEDLENESFEGTP